MHWTIDELFDWKSFELFVKELYSTDENLVVEHNITEIGKSGASRQIDVKVTQQTKLHTFTTIIECKFWKEAVDRATVDIVAASVEDLNASKGVIFTTKGFQAGAETYAKSKNIDIFVIRDVLDEEWGKPGRNVSIFLNIVGGRLGHAHFPNAQAALIVQEQPKNMDLDITLRKDKIYDNSSQLYSIKNGDEGPNFVEILIELHEQITKSINYSILEKEGPKEKTYLVRSPVLVDFTDFTYRQLRNKYAAINFDTIEMEVITQCSFSIMNIDRGQNFDYALIVQNYITDQRHYIYKNKKENTPKLVSYNPSPNTTDEDVLVNNSLLSVYLGPWTDINESTVSIKAKTEQFTLKIVDSSDNKKFLIKRCQKITS